MLLAMSLWGTWGFAPAALAAGPEQVPQRPAASATIEQTTGLRHVRDIWQSALSQAGPFRIGRLSVGSLLITHRQYTINGERTIVPGHIGVITNVDDSLSFIHASPIAGKVEERPLKTLQTIVGCVEVVN